VIPAALSLAYIVAGVVVANSHKYFEHVNTFTTGLSAALGVLLWPLVLVGLHLHLH
jgi:hypothetical protein